MTEVRLVDLAVIKRFSLAVRQEWASAEDVLAALEQSRQEVVDALAADGVDVADASTKRRSSRS